MLLLGCSKHSNLSLAAEHSVRGHPLAMTSKWLFDVHKHGKMRLLHQSSEFTLVPGEIVCADEPPVLHQIDVSWKPGEAPHLLHFQVESMHELDPHSAHVVGVSHSIAGNFSFVANTKTMAVETVFPGVLSVDLMLATLSHLKAQGSEFSARELTSLLTKDSLIAAQEMVRTHTFLPKCNLRPCTDPCLSLSQARELWDDIGSATRALSGFAAATPRPTRIAKSVGLTHKITVVSDCKDSFQQAMLREASKLLRHSLNASVDPTAIAFRPESVHSNRSQDIEEVQAIYEPKRDKVDNTEDLTPVEEVVAASKEPPPQESAFKKEFPSSPGKESAEPEISQEIPNRSGIGPLNSRGTKPKSEDLQHRQQHHHREERAARDTDGSKLSIPKKAKTTALRSTSKEVAPKSKNGTSGPSKLYAYDKSRRQKGSARMFAARGTVFRSSSDATSFSMLLDVCRTYPIKDLQGTSEALLGSTNEFKAEQAEQTTQFEVLTDRDGDLLRIRALRSRRCSFSFGPHYVLATGVKSSTTWIAKSSWNHYPFADHTLMVAEIQQYDANLSEQQLDLAAQYLPGKMSNKLRSLHVHTPSGNDVFRHLDSDKEEGSSGQTKKEAKKESSGRDAPTNSDFKDKSQSDKHTSQSKTPDIVLSTPKSTQDFDIRNYFEDEEPGESNLASPSSVPSSSFQTMNFTPFDASSSSPSLNPFESSSSTSSFDTARHGERNIFSETGPSHLPKDDSIRSEGEQSVSKEHLQENSTGKPYNPMLRKEESNEKADRRMMETAFRLCKHPLRDSITSFDLGQYLKKSGVISDEVSSKRLFDIASSLDSDSTGFLEYNEFYLFCHYLTKAQVRKMTVLSCPGYLLLGNVWQPVVIDLDMYDMILSIYTDPEHFALNPIERAQLARPKEEPEMKEGEKPRRASEPQTRDYNADENDETLEDTHNEESSVDEFGNQRPMTGASYEKKQNEEEEKEDAFARSIDHLPDTTDVNNHQREPQDAKEIHEVKSGTDGMVKEDQKDGKGEKVDKKGKKGAKSNPKSNENGEKQKNASRKNLKQSEDGVSSIGDLLMHEDETLLDVDKVIEKMNAKPKIPGVTVDEKSRPTSGYDSAADSAGGSDVLLDSVSKVTESEAEERSNRANKADRRLAKTEKRRQKVEEKKANKEAKKEAKAHHMGHNHALPHRHRHLHHLPHHHSHHHHHFPHHIHGKNGKSGKGKLSPRFDEESESASKSASSSSKGVTFSESTNGLSSGKVKGLRKHRIWDIKDADALDRDEIEHRVVFTLEMPKGSDEEEMSVVVGDENVADFGDSLRHLLTCWEYQKHDRHHVDDRLLGQLARTAAHSFFM